MAKIQKFANTDRVLGAPPLHSETARVMQDAFVLNGVVAEPLYGNALARAQYMTNLKGPLYALGNAVFVTGDEMSWAITRGYVRSEFYGETEIINRDDGTSVEVYTKPSVRYAVTEKGKATRVWY